MRRFTRRAVLAAAIVFSFVPTFADTPQEGFAVADLPYPGLFATTTLDNGDIISFDGMNFGRYDESGNLIAHLTSLPDFVYPSFLLVDPTETFILLGESSNGDVITVSLMFPVPLTIANVPFNYAAVFEDPDHVLISAASLGFGLDNQIYRVEVNSGSSAQIAQVSGASGPVAVDATGNVYYGTVSDAFPSPPGSSSVIMWTVDQAGSGSLLTESDAVIIEAGLDGTAALAYDLFGDRLYVAENNFGTGINRIRVVGGGAQAILLEGTTGFTISNFEFQGGDGLARLLPYQPAAARLLYNTTDFFSVFARRSLETLRPTATCTGVGTTGPGPFDVSFVDAPPNGFAIAYYNLQSSMPANEFVLNFKQLPLFFGLSLVQLGRVPGVIVADASGAGSATYVNPGGLEGLFGIQLLLFDATSKLVGSSTVALL